MFTQEQTTVHGKHYTVTDAMGNPKPVQQPHPPIMIGGTGEKVLLRDRRPARRHVERERQRRAHARS